MKYFGPRLTAPYWSVLRVPVPVGAICSWCGEAIGEADNGLLIPHLSLAGTQENPQHEECFVRSIAGSVAHQLGECSCFGGTREDAPGLTKRQAALEAHEMFLLLKQK